MKVRNIKCSVYTEGFLKDGLKRSEVYTFSMDDITIFIYGHSPHHLNVTGLKCIEDVNYVMRKLEEKFKIKCINVRIDNIFISHKDSKNIKLSNVYHYINETYAHLYIVDYNVELFPGMFLKPKSSAWPTIILFRTGSFTIMGGKDYQCILEAQTLVQKIINHFLCLE